jgi:EpsI family protein
MSDDVTPSAPALSRRNILTGIALMGAAGVAYARQPQPGKTQLGKDGLDGIIPKNFGNWKFETTSGLVLPPPDATADRLYDEVLTRVYTRTTDGQMIMFLVAYSGVQDGLLQLHRPEVCYPVGGYQLSQTVIQPIDLADGDKVPARAFTATSAMRVEQVLYWTRLGSSLPTSWGEQRWAVVVENLNGLIPDGVLVRMSCVEQDTEKAYALLREFAKDLAGSVTPKARKLLWKTA